MPVVISDASANNKAVVLSDAIWQGSVLTGIADDPANPALNATTDSTYDFWRQGGTAITRLRKTGAAIDITANACGISGHNLGSTGSRLYVLYSDDGTNWFNAVTPYDPLTDDPIFFIFPIRTHTFWEVAFGLSTGAYVSNVKLGRRLDFPCTPIDSYTPTHHAKRYEKYFNTSMNGQFLGTRVRSVGGSTDVSFPMIQRDFVDGPLLGFEDAYNRGRTFFYAGWPGGKPQDVAYCRARGQDDIVQVEYVQGQRLANLSFGVNTFGTP